MSQERLFVCSIMKALFSKYDKSLPVKFKTIIDRLQEFSSPVEEKFNNQIMKAVEILMDDEDANANQIDVHWDFFDDEIRGLTENFECRHFLTISVRYLSKAIDDYLMDETTDSLSNVYRQLVEVLERSKESGAFGGHSWGRLNNIAAEILAREEKVKQPTPKASKSKKHLQEFVLRIMDAVFQLYFRELPSILQEKLDEFPGNKDALFDPIIRTAIIAVLNDESLASKELGLKYKDFTDEIDSSLFEEVKFLVNCVCYSKTGLRYVIEEDEPYMSWHIFQFLVKEMAKFGEYLTHDIVLWNQMARAAHHIMTTYEKRNPDTDVEALSGSQSRLLTPVNDLSAESDSSTEESKCCACKCS